MPATTQAIPAVSPQCRERIDHLSRLGWDWFTRCTHPRTGMVLDRFPNFGEPRTPPSMASVASTGFYLTLLPEAVRRGWLTAAEAEGRAGATLRFAVGEVGHVDGILSHFVDWNTGRRAGTSEYSTLDTSIFLNGCMVAAGAYPRLGPLADRLIDRVDWTALVMERADGRRLLSYGYDGATRRRLEAAADVRSSENLMACVLAAGARERAIGRHCWYDARVVRSPDAPGVLNPSHPLFTSYYGLAWANLAGLHDADGVDLWGNARAAARWNRDYCRRVAARAHRTYRLESGGWWGLSAGDGPGGYVAPGPVDGGDPDGTVWPTAALGSVAWVPGELSEDVQGWAGSAGWGRALGRYGLSPFSVDREWVGPDLLGIDIGAFMAVWANATTGGALQALWAAHPVARRGLAMLEFSRP
jgi:hypothetical protein